MTEYKVETLADCLEEIKVLFKEHWDEVADPLIPLNPDYDKSNTLIQVLNNLGIITVMDLDDYWLPTKEHPAHHLVVQHKLHEKIINNLKIKTKLDYYTVNKLNRDSILNILKIILHIMKMKWKNG